MKKIILFISVLFLVINCFTQKKQDFPVLKGPYLGQKPPGNEPQLFAPGIISNNEILGCYAFMNEGKLFIFSRMPPNSDWKYSHTYVTELKDGIWTKPCRIPFQELYPFNFTGGVTQDGRTLYFSSLRLPDGSGKLGDTNIWIVYKTDNGWSKPEILNYPINTKKSDSYVSITTMGTIYFMSNREGGFGKTDLYRSQEIGGKYNRVENLGKSINTNNHEFDSFIAPDESYLIYCSETLDGYGKSDLFITFHKNDASWTEPLNMGKTINSPDYEVRPSVTQDGKYLFFTRGNLNPERSNIYWVDAKIIEQLKPKELK